MSKFINFISIFEGGVKYVVKNLNSLSELLSFGSTMLTNLRIDKSRRAKYFCKFGIGTISPSIYSSAVTLLSDFEISVTITNF